MSLVNFLKKKYIKKKMKMNKEKKKKI